MRLERTLKPFPTKSYLKGSRLTKGKDNICICLKYMYHMKELSRTIQGIQSGRSPANPLLIWTRIFLDNLWEGLSEPHISKLPEDGSTDKSFSNAAPPQFKTNIGFFARLTTQRYWSADANPFLVQWIRKNEDEDEHQHFKKFGVELSGPRKDELLIISRAINTISCST